MFCWLHIFEKDKKFGNRREILSARNYRNLSFQYIVEYVYIVLRDHITRRTSHQPLTLTTFRLPFCIPGIPGALGVPPTGFSVAFMPAFTVSIRTPAEIAGE